MGRRPKSANKKSKKDSKVEAVVVEKKPRRKNVKPSDNTWAVYESIVKTEGIARQHLNSYNEFIETGIQQIIDETSSIDIESLVAPYKVRFGKLRIGSPRVVEIDGSTTGALPLEARLRSLTYCSPLYVEMSIEEQGQITASQTHYIGDIPVMVNSDLCALSKMGREETISSGEDPRDTGGYFIINGSERVIVGLEDLSPNKIMVDITQLSGVDIFKSKVYSSIVGYRSKLEITLKPDGLINAKLPNSPTDLPVTILLRALGIETDKDMAYSISPEPLMHDFLDVTFERTNEIKTQNDALVYIGNRVAHGMIEEFRIKKAENILDWGLLPHLGKSPVDREAKAYFLGEVICKLFELKLGWITVDDKDHYGNKVIKFAGQMLADLFRTAFRNLIRDLKYQLERMSSKRTIGAVGAALRPGIITDKLNNSIATGNWGRGKVGVTQLVDRTNYLGTLSHLRRVQSPLSRSQPNFEARDLHATHFGRICPNETPEGANCGLVKNLALSTIISIDVPTSEILEHLSSSGLVPMVNDDLTIKSKGCKVFLDGKFIGYIDDGDEYVSNLRKLRREGKIHPHVSVSLYKVKDLKASRRLFISTNAGRVLRPVIIADNGVPNLTGEMIARLELSEFTWKELVNEGVLELLDADEEENAFIAMEKKDLIPENTHLEIHPAGMLGIASSLIPYPEHNQSPRNTYESAMAKQSLGFSSPTFPFNTHVRQHLLVYPQPPLVTTKALEMLGVGERASGQNCVVAVLSHEGYNIEDAVVFNKSSIDRGLARSFFYRIYDAEARQYLGGMNDVFDIPASESSIRGYRGEKYYRLLEEDGVSSTESVVTGGDVIIGRTSPPRFIEEYKGFETSGPYRRDTSVTVRQSETGVVDSVFFTESIAGGKLYKVRVRDMRIPEIGDKFASRHGQKGIVGLVDSQENMPYTENGIVPDIIINPHAFPSRMTVGQFLETIGSKAASLRGTKVDGTAFDSENIDSLGKVLEKHGFKSNGREVMYDGRTGKKFAAEVFIGVVYYQKLHHMVADKVHARARGQVQMLTKQPTEGRARGGGLRFGEMERDCLISYGASMMLKDRLLDKADKAEVKICEKCGLIAYFDARQRKYVCKVCGDSVKVSTVVMAYAFKLLLQEIMGLNVAPRISLKDTV